MDSSTSRVIGTAALISVGVGTLNSFYKNKKPPSMRFLIGSGAAYVALSAIGEGEPEVAKALAVAVAVTVTLGDGGGVLSYISDGEIDTQKKSKAEEIHPVGSSADLYDSDQGPFTPTESTGVPEYQYTGMPAAGPPSSVRVNPRVFSPDTIGLFPGVVTS